MVCIFLSFILSLLDIVLILLTADFQMFVLICHFCTGNCYSDLLSVCTQCACWWQSAALP